MVILNQQEKLEKRNIVVVKSEDLSSYSDDRYIIVDPETDEILDDAQGYGYKSKRKAYACWAWKTRDKSKDKEKAQRKSHIQKSKLYCHNVIHLLLIKLFDRKIVSQNRG